MKTASEQYLRLLAAVHSAVGYPCERHPIIIGIDGQNGAGKSHIGSWLAWQLGAVALHLDLYRAYDADGNASGWRVDDLAYAVSCRVDRGQPVIVEGVLLLEALSAIKRRPDFLIYVRRPETTTVNKLSSVGDYLRTRKPPIRESDHTLLGFVPEAACGPLLKMRILE